jgi:hypothetical protein
MIDMLGFSFKELFTILPWWGLVLLVIYIGWMIYIGLALLSNCSGKFKNFGRGMKWTFFDEYEGTHFTLYDLLRMIFFLPGIVLGIVFMLTRAGAINFFPFLRKIFGLKLFRIEKEK